MRLLVAETLDPDGAMVRWASPDLAALGHDVLPLPTQELAPVLGAHGLGRWIEAVVEAFEPALVLVCPPYDHASAATWRACRARGAKVVGFAMDEPLFASARARPAIAARHAAAVAAFDRLYVASPEHAAALAARGLPARPLRWALSPAALASPEVQRLAPDLAATLARSAVLVGRAYERRVALVRELAAHVPVHVFGHGWDAARAHPAVVHGPLTGEAMPAVLRAAGVVVTTGDWEATPLPMVKVRLLEAAFAGAAQVAQGAPDLDAYFTPDEVPRYDDVAGLVAHARALLAAPDVARAMAARATARALAEHTWRARFAELAADLDREGALDRAASPSSSPAPPPPPSLPAVYEVGLLAAASAAEQRGARRLASALYRQLDHAMGLARTRLADAPREAAAAARRALAQRAASPHASDGLYARVPTPAPALGHVGFLDPTPELLALELSATLRGDLAAAHALVAALIDGGDDDRLVATAAILQPDGDPAHAALWRMLFAAALAATPADGDLHAQHRARFAAAAAAPVGAPARE